MENGGSNNQESCIKDHDDKCTNNISCNMARWRGDLHCCLAARRSWVQFLSGEDLSLWSLHILPMSVWVSLQALWFSPAVIKNMSRLMSSQCPRPNALMRIWIYSLGAAQRLPAAPQKRLGQMQNKFHCITLCTLL